jgi:signal transduction histidine kinase
MAAMKGGVKSKLIYRDTFNLFDQEGEEDNLIQTYVPIKEAPWGPVVGVFEVYKDVMPMARRIERTEVLMAFWVAATLFGLYILLLFVVHRSEKTIDKQRETILERTRTLELLSARMLSAEERERGKIATQLHEGVAQHLSAIKLRIEQLCLADTAKQEAGGESGLCERVVPEVQKAIQDVRAMAMDIHPPSLDDFGLLPTVSWLKNEFTAIYPAMQIESGATIEEGRIPVPMKAIMFRIIQETLGWIAKRSRPDRVRIKVGGSRHELTLSIEHNGAPWPAPQPGDDGETLDELELSSIRQRIILSGGDFQMQSKEKGWNGLYASWEA